MDRTLLEVYKSDEFNYEDYKQLALTAKDNIKAIRKDIYDEVINDNDLALIQSPSQDATWEFWASLWAYLSWLLHSFWIVYQARLKKAALEVIPHNEHWYSVKALQFQLGDTLDATNGKVIYPLIDESKQIVKAASVKSTSNGDVILKVAKKNALGLEPLSSPELIAFRGYMNSIQDAGVSLFVVSQNADLLKVLIDVYYNPIIPLATMRANVEVAINNYLQNLPFDGIVRITKLIDAIQAVEGVVDIEIKDCQASTSYTSSSSFVPVEVFYETVAGYINIDPNYPLSSQLNFISNA